MYQKAANLGNSVAQYNLASMYECRKDNEIDKNMDQAIYWSAEQGFKMNLIFIINIYYIFWILLLILLFI